MGGYSKQIYEATKKYVPSHEDEVAQKARAARNAHKILRSHPNLEFPVMPRKLTPENTTKFVIDCVSAYLSPIKLEGEDNSFQCEDVARAIRMELRKEIVDIVNLALLEGRSIV